MTLKNQAYSISSLYILEYTFYFVRIGFFNQKIVDLCVIIQIILYDFYKKGHTVSMSFFSDYNSISASSDAFPMYEAGVIFTNVALSVSDNISRLSANFKISSLEIFFPLVSAFNVS